MCDHHVCADLKLPEYESNQCLQSRNTPDVAFTHLLDTPGLFSLFACFTVCVYKPDLDLDLWVVPVQPRLHNQCGFLMEKQ